MQCPIDGNELVLAERAGVEIDYCPKCRGVWLDRGELDKIIDRSAAEAGPAPRAETGHHPRDDDRGYSGGKPRKKRGGFLEELFDF
ncbi:Zn-finger nucleic acid-binding protein [Roseovarius sp. MBR-154]|jgi:Zn-finger nucleic acid-binding protein